MLLSYGLVRLQYEEQTYTLLPSFANIEKIGSPQEIVDIYSILLEQKAPWYVLRLAAEKVLKACSDKELPYEMIGRATVSAWTNNLVLVKPKSGMTEYQLQVLALHLLLHGVVGSIKFKAKKNNEAKPLKEFNISEYIESAVLALNVSYQDAANMTMTQFISLMANKFPDHFKQKDPQGVTDDQQMAMVEYMKQNGMLN